MIDLSQFSPEERRHAESYASDPVLGAILEALSTKYISAWRGSRPEQADQREQAYQMVLALEELRNELRSVADDRKVTAHNSRSRN